MRKVWIICSVMLCACSAAPQTDEAITQPPTVESGETVAATETALPATEADRLTPTAAITPEAPVNATSESAAGDPRVDAITFLEPPGLTDGIPTYPADTRAVSLEIA